MRETFNKVDQNQLQRTKNVVYFLDAAKTISISAWSISNRAEMTCGTARIIPFHSYKFHSGWSYYPPIMKDKYHL